MKPSAVAVRFSLLLAALALATVFVPGTLWVFEGLASTWLTLLVIDGLLAIPKPVLDVQRKVPSSLPVGVWTKVVLELVNESNRRCALLLADHHPPSMEASGMPVHCSLDRDGRHAVTYALRPKERGYFWFAPVQLLARSRLGLWQRTLRLGPAMDVRVYPNFREISNFNLLSASHHLGQLGIRKQRKRGEGMEFHQLREYLQGDALRLIDWKTSAKYGKLISREYQDERDQRVFFLVDCGHAMRSQDGMLSHFDHALNAVLLLAKVALKQGDAVGLMTFGGSSRLLAPRKGIGQLNLILNTTYDLQPTLRSSDYLDAARILLARLKKRALVILLTNLRDEDYQELIPSVSLLRGKHLVLLASMRERVLGRVVTEPVTQFEDALRLGSTHLYLRSRYRALESLKRQGILCLDVEPSDLAVASVNAYLEIKSKGLL